MYVAYAIERHYARLAHITACVVAARVAVGEGLIVVRRSPVEDAHAPEIGANVVEGLHYQQRVARLDGALQPLGVGVNGLGEHALLAIAFPQCAIPSRQE